MPMHPGVRAQGKAPIRWIACVTVWLFTVAVSRAAEIGRVCDRNGVLLMEVERLADGKIRKHFPLKAFAVHSLESLAGSALPSAGETVYLTLDARIQMSAEKALRSVGRGSAVIADPKTGDILAMASVPSYDHEAIDKAHWEILNADKTDPMLNRAARVAYRTRATYYPVLLLAAASKWLDAFQHTCTGSVVLDGPDRVVKCHAAHGEMDARSALNESCLTYFYSLGVQLGSEAVSDMGKSLGFGERSGLPISWESSGQVNIEIERLWIWSGTLQVASSRTGDDVFLTTPVQTAGLASALANWGEIWKPRLVDRVLRKDGATERNPEVPVRKLSEEGVSREGVGRVRDAMFAMVEEPDGKAKRGRVPGYRVAGIVGTSSQRKSDGTFDQVAAFAGFAESKEKVYAFSVWTEGAGSSGEVAAPIASEILSSIGKYEAEPLAPALGSMNAVESMPNSFPNFHSEK